MKSCVAYLTKNSLGSPAVAAARIASNICHWQPPTMYSECSMFHPNRFTFGGVIAERVNAAETRRKLNPIFGRSLASSRIIRPIITVTVNTDVVCGNRRPISRYMYISETVQDRDIVTMDGSGNRMCCIEWCYF